MKQISSIGQVNFRKNRDLEPQTANDYFNAEQVLGSLAKHGSKAQFDSEVHTLEASSAAAKDTYLKMMKNKDQFTRKITVGSGFEV